MTAHAAKQLDPTLMLGGRHTNLKSRFFMATWVSELGQQPAAAEEEGEAKALSHFSGLSD